MKPSLPAVVLLSGGLDSTTAMAIARSQGFEVHALTIDYGQRHAVELEAARRVAAALGAREHLVLPVNLRLFGGSALTADEPVPKDRQLRADEIPVTYVPARNVIFLSLALAYAEVRQAQDIFIGASNVDYSGYPDCRPEFFRAFEQVANLATRAGLQGRPFRIHTPLMNLSKAEIIRQGLELGVDYSLTHSCYDPDPQGRACGHCDSCRLRLRAFAQLGLSDPARYAEP